MERCFWMPADEKHLITYIENNRAKGGDGLNFDKAFWAQAAANIVQSTTCGAVTTGVAYSSKWARLCATYNIVDRVAQYSGVAWSTDSGANITAESKRLWQI
ncbi:hypothetical protein P692DRAFT_20739551 [Suillus brevipes Sb2]|nr:hypothetical protein P692DRAFT_20739551 [Suillus brevipes Sb2]